MAVSEILRVYPTIETLCEPIKGRPVSSTANGVKKIFHCPVDTCKYNRSDCSFVKMKFLRQHFFKVHQIKSFSCNECGKQFSLESTLRRHKLICGVTYRCYCNAEYNAYEALITHIKRKHPDNFHLKYRNMMQLLQVHSTVQNFQKSCDNDVRVEAIIVEDFVKQKLLRLKEKKKNASSKETQTGMKMYKILPNPSSQMQTNNEQNIKKTVSMQTIIEGMSRKRKRSRINNPVCKINLPPADVSFSTSSTQTSPVKETQATVFPQDCVQFDLTKEKADVAFLSDEQSQSTSLLNSDFSSFNATSMNSSAPCIFNDRSTKQDLDLDSLACFAADENKSCAVETQSNAANIEAFINDLLQPGTNVITSDSETQTIFEDYFDHSYMDTYTQTCESLFSDLDFVDIETQTPWSLFDDT